MRKWNKTAEEAEKMSAAEIAAYLPEKARRFLLEWRIDFNGTQAAIRAGYAAGKNNTAAASAAARLLSDERVIAYRRAVEREEFQKIGFTREALALRLQEIYDRCMEKKPVMVWDSSKKAWVESGVWQFNAGGAIKAVELLDRMLAPPDSRGGSGEGGIEKYLEELEAQK